VGAGMQRLFGRMNMHADLHSHNPALSPGVQVGVVGGSVADAVRWVWAAQRWQAAYRGRKGRKQVHEMHVAATNTRDGIMHPMSGTTPGETGWYQADASVYLFEVSEEHGWQKVRPSLQQPELSSAHSAAPF
jgi:hypothetical protein